jgi:endoglucanase
LNANLSFASNAITGAESLFEVKVLGNTVNVTGITAMSDKVVSLDIDRSIFYTDDVLVSYTGNSIVSDVDTPLQTFTDLEVINKVDPSVLLPDIIQAENFDEQQGFGLEETTDLGGGLNIGFSDIGDYADYKIFNREMADFKISLRLAGQDQAGSIGLYLLGEDGVENELVVIETPRTGGWQTWETVSEVVEIPEGAYTLRLRVLSPGFNLNWINIQSFILGGLDQQVSKVSIFPESY